MTTFYVDVILLYHFGIWLEMTIKIRFDFRIRNKKSQNSQTFSKVRIQMVDTRYRFLFNEYFG